MVSHSKKHGKSATIYFHRIPRPIYREIRRNSPLCCRHLQAQHVRNSEKFQFSTDQPKTKRCREWKLEKIHKNFFKNFSSEKFKKIRVYSPDFSILEKLHNSIFHVYLKHRLIKITGSWFSQHGKILSQVKGSGYLNIWTSKNFKLVFRTLKEKI